VEHDSGICPLETAHRTRAAVHVAISSRLAPNACLRLAAWKRFADAFASKQRSAKRGGLSLYLLQRACVLVAAGDPWNGLGFGAGS
jgi:hypothetical protein